MPYVANNVVTAELRCLAVADDGTLVSGLSTTPGVDFAITLRRQSGATFVAASETVTIAEPGGIGYYTFTFTPQNTGQYNLYVREMDPATMVRDMPYTYMVLPAGAVFEPTITEGYCAETDVERVTGLNFTTTTQVTSAMVLAFIVERAAVIESWCARWGLTITPTAVVAGSRLAKLLMRANEVGAGLDAVISWYTQVEPAENEKARLLLTQWVALMGDGDKITGALEVEVLSAASDGIRTPYTSGEMIPATEQTITDGGLSMFMDAGKVF